MDDYLRDSVPIEKDVEGLCHTYRFLPPPNLPVTAAHTTRPPTPYTLNPTH